jgi:hypothetical protein
MNRGAISRVCTIDQQPAREKDIDSVRVISVLRRSKMLGTILIVLLILALVGALPTWPHSRGWGYYPTGGLGAILLIVVILVLLGRI